LFGNGQGTISKCNRLLSDFNGSRCGEIQFKSKESQGASQKNNKPISQIFKEWFFNVLGIIAMGGSFVFLSMGCEFHWFRWYFRIGLFVLGIGLFFIAHFLAQYTVNMELSNIGVF